MFYTPRFQSVTRLALGAALLGTAELTLQAQDALRGSVEEDRAYHGRQTQDTEPYKLRAGPIKFSADFSVAVELNDNANLLPSTRGTNAEDVILRPLWQFNGIFPVTQESRISFGVGVGYQKYFRYHERDRAYVRPNSELAYDLVARDTVITFYDRFLYDQEVTAASNLGGATNFLPRFDNTIGARVTWNPSHFLLSFGYAHQNFVTTGDFDFLNRSVEQVLARVGYTFYPETRVGLEGSGGLTDYQRNLQRNNRSITVGPFAEWQVTSKINLAVHASYVHYKFDGLSAADPGYGLNSFYMGFDLTHHLTDFIRHGISFVREIEPGVQVGSDFIETTSVRYFAQWSMTQHSDLGISVSYDHGRQPQKIGAGPSTTEHYDRLGGGVSFTHRLTDHFALSAAYDHYQRASDVKIREYRQNRVTLAVDFRL